MPIKSNQNVSFDNLINIDPTKQLENIVSSIPALDVKRRRNHDSDLNWNSQLNSYSSVYAFDWMKFPIQSGFEFHLIKRNIWMHIFIQRIREMSDVVTWTNIFTIN